MRIVKWIGMAFVLTVMAMGVWSGCEQAEGVNGLSVSPSSVTIGGSSSNASTVAFTASVSGPLALPLEWSVANASLGWIVSQSGSNAVYKANSGAKGENIITVSDQYGNEGSAVVKQE